MQIRAGEGRHVEPVWELMQRCMLALEAQGIRQWDDVYPTRDTVTADVIRGGLFVLEDDGGRTAGSVALDDRQSPEYALVSWTGGEPVLVVHRLCVDPSMQGKGYARQLMDFTESYASERGYTSIRLDAYSANERSVALYRRRGYREVGQVHFPRRALPFWCFELVLDPSRTFR